MNGCGFVILVYCLNPELLPYFPVSLSSERCLVQRRSFKCSSLMWLLRPKHDHDPKSSDACKWIWHSSGSEVIFPQIHGQDVFEWIWRIASRVLVDWLPSRKVLSKQFLVLREHLNGLYLQNRALGCWALLRVLFDWYDIRCWFFSYLNKHYCT